MLGTDVDKSPFALVMHELIPHQSFGLLVDGISAFASAMLGRAFVGPPPPGKRLLSHNPAPAKRIPGLAFATENLEYRVFLASSLCQIDAFKTSQLPWIRLLKGRAHRVRFRKRPVFPPSTILPSWKTILPLKIVIRGQLRNSMPSYGE